MKTKTPKDGNGAKCTWRRRKRSGAGEPSSPLLVGGGSRGIDEISPAASSAQSPGGCDVDAHRPALMGKHVQKDGKDKGKIKTKVDRCTMCQKRNHRPDHGRAPRTSYCCAMHPKVFLCSAHKGPCIKQHQDEYSSCSNDVMGI